ncbi:MAG: hypothetical protein ABI175_11430 [Polyangiales bacterium]
MASQHEVKAGEHMVRICAENKQRDYRPIWDHADNKPLTKDRKNPNLLLPGDIVVLPDAKAKTVTAKTEKHHVFIVKGKLELDFRIVLIDENDKPIADKEVDFLKKGETATSDGDGKVEKIDLPFKFELGTLEFEYRTIDLSTRGTQPPELWQGEEIVEPRFVVAIGHLDPLETVSGVQGRLNNLGYYAGEIGYAEEDEIAVKCAVEEFEVEHGLKPKGDPEDDGLRTKLKEVYGC